MSNYERIKTSINASKVDGPDKMKLCDIFAEIEDEKLTKVADLFEKKNEWVVTFNDTRKKKLEAYKTFNKELLQEVLEEEKKYLEEPTFSHD